MLSTAFYGFQQSSYVVHVQIQQYNLVLNTQNS